MPLSNAERIKIHQILRPLPLPTVAPAWTYLPSATYLPWYAYPYQYPPGLPPPPDPIAVLDDLITNLTDPDAIAAIQTCFAKWDAIQSARNPNRAGLVEADVVKWDAKARNEDFSLQEGNVKCELAIGIGWQIQPVFPF